MTPSDAVREPLGVEIDRSSAIPLYAQVAQQFEAAIRSAVISPGSRLENELDLVDRLAVSRPVIRQAMQELVDKGLVVRRRGVGTQVVHGALERPIDLTSLHDDLELSGRTPSTRVLSLTEELPTPAMRTALSLGANSYVVSIRRVRYADGQPIALMSNWIPRDRLGERGLDLHELQERGLYESLRARGIMIRVAHQSMSARRALASEAELLDVAPGSALLTMQRTAHDEAGGVVELGDHVYRPDRYHFTTTLVAR